MNNSNYFKQPEALRLADALEADQQGIDLGAEGMGWGPSTATRTQAAAELRRLYAEVDRLSYQLAYPDNFVKPASIAEALGLLKEAREWVTEKPWDDNTYLHKRISEFLGLPVEYPDWPYGRDGWQEEEQMK